MSDRGRITIPSAIREALHLDDNAQLRLDIVDDRLVITPAITIAREDAWAYTPEERAAIERARSLSSSTKNLSPASGSRFSPLTMTGVAGPASLICSPRSLSRLRMRP